MPLPSHAHQRAFQVFARHDSEPALHHIGEVWAESDADARVFAHTLYDERRWQELCVVPAAAITTLVRPE